MKLRSIATFAALGAIFALIADNALGGSFPSPPLYPSFTSPKTAIKTFDLPGSTQTYAYSINAKGAVAGDYRGTDSLYHGFVRTPDGKFTLFDAPGNGSYKEGAGILFACINSKDVVAGSYIDTSARKSHKVRGFVRAANGSIVNFDIPESSKSPFDGIYPTSLNSNGVIAGYFEDKHDVSHGFVRYADATVAVIDVPGAGADEETREGTTVTGINDSGVITGYYVDRQSAVHSFLRAAHGTITKFDAPNAASDRVRVGTFAQSINSAGLVAGYYEGKHLTLHAFVRAANGNITVFDAPHAGEGQNVGTQAFAVNNAGLIAGDVLRRDISSGFARAVGGTITEFHVSHSVLTTPQGINEKSQIAGYYIDGANRPHGFVLGE